MLCPLGSATGCVRVQLALAVTLVIRRIRDGRRIASLNVTFDLIDLDSLFRNVGLNDIVIDWRRLDSLGTLVALESCPVPIIQLSVDFRV